MDSSYDVVSKAKEFIEYLWNSVKTEYDPDTQSHQLQSIKEIIKNMGLFLTKEEVDDLGQKIIVLLDQSLQKRGLIEKQVASDYSDDEED